MSEPFIGEIKTWALNYAPRDWSFCDGQYIPISQNTALFALLGTVYGGDGRTNFCLPDLRGRVPMHKGAGPGLSYRQLGQRVGVEQVTLTTSPIPAHTHTLTAGDVVGDTESTANAYLAKGVTEGGREPTPIDSYSNAAPTKALNSESLQMTGGHLAHGNMQPYLPLNMCIALQGLFPSRS